MNILRVPILARPSSFIFLFLVVVSRGLAQEADFVVAPQSVAAGSGLMVDNFEQGPCFGTYSDGKGSTSEATIVPYSTGTGHYLRLAYHCVVVPGAHTGIYTWIGPAGGGKPQDWSQLTNLHFTACASIPTELTIELKGQDDQYKFAAHWTVDSKEWQAFTIPITAFTPIESSNAPPDKLGIVKGLKIAVSTQANGIVAFDDITAEGATGLP